MLKRFLFLCRRSWLVVKSQAAELVATLALIGLALGFWMAWPPLGLIVPSLIVLGCLIWTHLSGGR